MGNAFVAVDAVFLAGKEEALVRLCGARRLLGDVHRLRAVTIAAFQRIVGLESRPFMQRQFEPLVHEFFSGVDEAEQMTPDLVGGLHLARDLVGPVVRNVAIRAGGADAGAVGEMDRRFQFGEHVVAHLVTPATKPASTSAPSPNTELAWRSTSHNSTAKCRDFVKSPGGAAGLSGRLIDQTPAPRG